MSRDLCFKTIDALKAGFPVNEGETREFLDEDGDIIEKKLADTQNVGGWQGIVCPEGDTIAPDKPEVRAALKTAGIKFTEC